MSLENNPPHSLPLPTPDDLLSVLSTREAASMFDTMAEIATRIGDNDTLEAQEAGFALYNVDGDLVLSELVVPDPEDSIFGLEGGQSSVDLSSLIRTEVEYLEWGPVGTGDVRSDLAAVAHIHPTGHDHITSIHCVQPSVADINVWKKTLEVNPNQLEIIMGADTKRIKFLLMRKAAGLAINDTFEAMEARTEREAHRALKLSNVICTNLLFDRRAKKFQPNARTILKDFLKKDEAY